jgi:hypothetical protein
MLCNAIFRLSSQSDGYSVVGLAHSTGVLGLVPSELHEHCICGVNVENLGRLVFR